MSEMKYDSNPEKKREEAGQKNAVAGTSLPVNGTKPCGETAAHRKDVYDRICSYLLKGGRIGRTVGGMLLRGRQLILYAFFGTLTTAVDLAVYYPLKFSLPETRLGTIAANAAAWTAAVTFAFFTNKKFVFSDHRRCFGTVALQMLSFASGRLLSFGVETGILLIGDALLAAWASTETVPWLLAYAPKLLAQILVLIMNYLISKFLVFRRDRENR